MNTASVGVRTLPLIVNSGIEERVKHAAYRVNAIARHLEQNSFYDAQRVEEFSTELMEHMATLNRAKHKDVVEAAAEVLASLKGT